MKVLIALFDLYSTLGGGQTFYRGLIRANPEIQFYYLGVHETADAPRPTNAHCIVYRHEHTLGLPEVHDDLSLWYESFRGARNLAYSVAGQAFDVVDIPDFMQFGPLLRAAFSEYGVSCPRIAISLHGIISRAERLAWWPQRPARQLEHLERVEEVQYRTADIRYGISERYGEEWRRRTGFPARLIDPLYFVPRGNCGPATASPNAPELTFIGRTEKLKGPDLFLDLVWALPRSSYTAARIAGPPPTGMDQVNGILRSMMTRRQVEVEMWPAQSPDQLAALFATRSVTVLPSRWDTLNLIALESLFAGCPTIIGSGAGVCDFLRSNLPQVPFIELDPARLWNVVPEVVGMLREYDAYRDRLVAAISQCAGEPVAPLAMDVYRGDAVFDRGLREEMARLYDEVRAVYGRVTATSGLRRKVASAVRRVLPKRLRRYASRKSFQRAVRGVARSLANRVKPALTDTILAVRQARRMPETGAAEIDRKVESLRKVAHEGRFDRVGVWRDLARLERKRGSALVGATYELRILRALGTDRYGLCGAAKATLEEQGYPREAAVADAMFGDYPENERFERCRSLLDSALADHRGLCAGNPLASEDGYEILEDQRGTSATRVGVIVSMYNTGSKLRPFLEILCEQSLHRRGAMEVVLVDSGSPSDEYAQFQQFLTTRSIPILYARSKQRETIQAAWNRGIALSRSPYLTFLGVDEAVHPECLEILAAELDADDGLDWVQANSLMTDVDADGSFVRDVMCYDRAGYCPELVYLDTCYLSWVGALQRRTIYDRCGLYDASFRAAGDTEFKNRVLPKIRTKHVPKALGLFRNYPEVRTTEHPRAEIEDLRAWYLHRTLAGVSYAFADRDPQAAETLLHLCLRYRKSYCTHASTDLELGACVMEFLKQRRPTSVALELADDLAQLVEAHRGLDNPRSTSLPGGLGHMAYAKRLSKRLERKHRRWSALHNMPELLPEYRVFNDNRYEQHNNAWRVG